MPRLGTPWRRAHRGFERCGSVVRPQEGYSPEILSHLSYEYVPSKGIRGLFLERTINSTIIMVATSDTTVVPPDAKDMNT